MSQQALTLTDFNTSKTLTLLTLATTQVHTKVFLSNEHLFLNLDSTPATSNFKNINEIIYPESYQTMIASERVLAKDWNQPDEDEAWVNL